MTSQPLLRIPSHILARQVGDEVIILDLESGAYFGLDQVGARVWQLVVEGQSPDAICNVLIAEFDAPRSQVTSDCKRLFVELLEKRLLVETSAV